MKSARSSPRMSTGRFSVSAGSPFLSQRLTVARHSPVSRAASSIVYCRWMRTFFHDGRLPGRLLAIV